MVKIFCINFDNSVKDIYLTSKGLNRANTEVELPNIYKEVFTIIEKIDFVIMNLELATNDICSIAPNNIQKQANVLLTENKARAGIVIAKCKKYVKTVDNIPLTGSSMSLLTDFLMMSPIFVKTIPIVQGVQTIPSTQEFQVDPKMLVVVKVNIETAFNINEDNLSMAQLLQWEFEI